MPVRSTDTWDISNTVTSTQSIATESMSSPQGTFVNGTMTTASIASASIPLLNGGIPMVTGAGGSFGSAAQIPTISVAANGAVSIGTANVSDNFTSNLNSTSDTIAASANALNQVYQMVLAANGGANVVHANSTANGILMVVDSVSNTDILVAAAANSVKLAYDTALAAFTNAAARADTAYTNAIAWSGNAALAFANAAARADAAYTNAIAYSGNAALAYANAVSYVDGLAIAYRGVAQTISGVWTHTANILVNANTINLGNTTGRWLLYANTGDFSGNVAVGGDLVVTGNLSINGTTTTFNSTQLTVDDPIITLGGETAPVADDNKDRGVEYRWHDGSSAKVGFFGYDDSAQEFVFFANATNTSEVFSGDYGDVRFRNQALTGNLNISGAVTSNINPSTNGTLYVGNATNRWEIYANSVYSSNVYPLDTLHFNQSKLNHYILFNGSSNSTETYISQIHWHGGATGDVDRWILGTTANLETGSNAGKNLRIARYNDAGTFQDAVFFYRNTGLIEAPNGMYFVAGSVIPGSNTQLMGNTTQRWVVNGNTGNFSGAVTSVAHITANTYLYAPTFYVGNTIDFNNPANNDALIYMNGSSNSSVSKVKHIYLRGGDTGYVTRWIVGTSSSLESGSDVGSDFVINRYNDSGVYQDQMLLRRSNGILNLANGLYTAAGSILPASNTQALGSSTARWVITGNTATLSSTLNVSGLTTLATANVTGAIELRANVLAVGTSNEFVVRGGGTSNGMVQIQLNNSTAGTMGLAIYRDSPFDATTRVFSYTRSVNFAFGANVVPMSNTVNLGNTTARWIIVGNTGNFSSTLDVTGITTLSANVLIGGQAYYTTIPTTAQQNTLGLAHIIPEAQNGSYTIALDDFNQMKRFVTGAANTWTIANNSTIAYPLGFTWIARNFQANVLTVARATGVTIRKAGSTTNTDITINQWGYVSFTQEDTNVWVASGTY